MAAYTTVEVSPVIDGVKAMTIRYSVTKSETMEELAGKLGPGLLATIAAALPPPKPVEIVQDNSDQMAAAASLITALEADLAAAKSRIETLESASHTTSKRRSKSNG